MAKPLHNAECFASHMGLWLCEPEILRHAHAAILSGTFKARAMEDDGDDGGDASVGYSLDANGIATIDIAGPMAKAAGKYASAGTVGIRQTLRAAADNPAVKAILLCIDSPGGTVSGTQALGDEVASVNAVKPVWAQIEDMGASAAYWVASQARGIFANESAIVGSLGTYAVVYDSSGQAAMQGVKVHVLATGPHKGAFVDGAPVLPEQLKERQTMVDDLNALFIRAVASGRNMSNAADLFDGRVHVAAKAKEIGLIDGIQSRAQTLAAIAMSPARMLGGGFSLAALSGASATGPIATTSRELISPPATQEQNMAPKSLDQVAALVKAHPAHAVLITELAAADKTEEQINAAIVKKDADAQIAADAAELAAARTEIAELKAGIDAREKLLAKAGADAVELQAKHDALAALKNGAAAGSEIKNDPAPVSKGPKKTAEEFETMDGKARAEFMKSGGTITG